MLNHAVIHFIAFEETPKVVPVSFHTPNDMEKLERLEILFDRTHEPGEGGIIQDLEAWECRNLSTGDVVFLEGYCFLACSVGFAPLKPDEYREYISFKSLLNRITWVRKFECRTTLTMKAGVSVNL